MKLQTKTNVDIWGGLECTINRVGDNYFDQLDYSGHYLRAGDIEQIVELGVKKMRYPVLWEKHQPEINTDIDWSFTETNLLRLKENNIDPIAGLVHHGSGPAYVNMLEDSFANGVANFAAKVATKFPWLKYYTPINEPLTTARFCGLYGVWHPHKTDDQSFCQILVNECKATVLAMEAVRRVNPDAQLVQTDDLGKIHSTPLLKYQADFENHRRWLAFDLLCGKVTPVHPLWSYLIKNKVNINDLYFLIDRACPPAIIGCNHYLTSERYLDENLENYPEHTYGGNKKHRYADIEAVRVGHVRPDGPYNLLKETWDRYKIPMAVTEVHLHCTREEQMRWLNLIWDTTNQLKDEGVDIVAITPWALLGSFGWNRLLTQPGGDYEPGVFDVGTGYLRPTVLAKMISAYSNNQEFKHPVINNKGWWQRNSRVIYGEEKFFTEDGISADNRPLLITGKTGTLGNAFARLCSLRGITCRILDRSEMDITDFYLVEKVILETNPWAIVNTAGFVRVDDAETQSGSCFAVNTHGAENLALLCEKYGIKLLTFSTDMVFDGQKANPYLEKDRISPLNIYGQSKALAEKKVLEYNPAALVIRTSAFFGPWDKYNFIKVAMDSLQAEKQFTAVNDVMISPTYVPDLVNSSLNLLLDDEKGIWHLTNDGQISWAGLAYTIAERCDLKTELIKSVPLIDFGFVAKRPTYSVLSSEKGYQLPPLEDALDRCLQEIN